MPVAGGTEREGIGSRVTPACGLAGRPAVVGAAVASTALSGTALSGRPVLRCRAAAAR